MVRATKRGQSALEFLILAGFMFTASTMFLVVLSAQSDLMASQQRQQELALVAQTIHQEVLQAHRVHDGYARIFELPATANGIPYTVDLLSGREIIVRAGEEEYLMFLPTDVRVRYDAASPGYPTGTLPGRRLLITKHAGAISLGVPPSQ
jgi:hypothetical protein